MKYALDTNTVVAALNGVPPVPARLAAVDAADILLPAPMIAELYFGARASLRVRENVARVDRLLTFFRLHPFDEAAARRFAEIKADLRKTGRAKSDFDLAIARTTNGLKPPEESRIRTAKAPRTPRKSQKSWRLMAPWRFTSRSINVIGFLAPR
ncbi:PIN domain-containing protein [Sorangium sp. So ce426]|uniref:PIN domain-containing protein n=1 Tax=Sorangium sp. So ce426 TaxID=3133312 RepID=UPI003F5C90A2